MPSPHGPRQVLRRCPVHRAERLPVGLQVQDKRSTNHSIERCLGRSSEQVVRASSSSQSGAAPSPDGRLRVPSDACEEAGVERQAQREGGCAEVACRCLSAADKPRMAIPDQGLTSFTLIRHRRMLGPASAGPRDSPAGRRPFAHVPPAHRQRLAALEAPRWRAVARLPRAKLRLGRVAVEFCGVV